MQTLVVLLIIAAAGIFLVARAVRSWNNSRKSSGCASDCGCSDTSKTPKSWDTTTIV